MDIDLFTRMEGLVGGVLISPAKSKVKHMLVLLVKVTVGPSQF